MKKKQIIAHIYSGRKCQKGFETEFMQQDQKKNMFLKIFQIKKKIISTNLSVSIISSV